MWWIIIIVWRIFLFGISGITAAISQYAPRFPYSDIYLLTSELPQWVWTWANFDGVHYLTISEGGYWAQFTQAFFPLYPLLVRGVGTLFGDTHFIISGLLISFLAFIVAFKYWRQLLLLDYPISIVTSASYALLVFPTSFYFGALYTESLFFLFVVASFWFARKKKWWISGMLGMFASGTRITGILLLPALLWEYHNVTKQKTKNKNLRLWNFIISSLHSPILYIVPLGLVSYMVYLHIQFGDALYFWHAQPVFGAARTGSTLIFPPQVVFRYIKIVLTVSWSRPEFRIAVLELGSFLFGCWALWKGYVLNIRRSYLLFGFFILLLPTLTGTFSSLPRYVLLVFPMYIVIAKMSARWRFVFSILSFILLLFLSHQFLRGQWVA